MYPLYDVTLTACRFGFVNWLGVNMFKTNFIYLSDAAKISVSIILGRHYFLVQIACRLMFVEVIAHLKR